MPSHSSDPAAEATTLVQSSPSGGGASTTALSTRPPASATTMTITETSTTATATTHGEQEVLRLTLAARQSVHWDENVQDNEGMGRKSSKRCCIFHKQREFGESSTDSSGDDSDRSGSSAASEGNDDGDKKPKAVRKHRKIARPKQGVPDFQRFHA